MSRSHDSGSSSIKRRSLFTRAPLTALTPIQATDAGKEKEPANVLKKKRNSSFIANSFLYDDGGEEDDTMPILTGRSYSARLGSHTNSFRGSWRSLRSSEDHSESPAAASPTTVSLNWNEPSDVTGRNRHVLRHGEVQTSSSMFRKKKEYLVLTECHIVRFKSQLKASEVFPEHIRSTGKSSAPRHSHTPSGGSAQDPSSAHSETSGDRDFGTPLRHVIAVYPIEDGRPYFALEVVCLEDETNHASCMTLQFGDPEDMNDWLTSLREATRKAHLLDPQPISLHNAHIAARTVERERDYDPPDFSLYKVALRSMGKASSRSSSDDLTKIATVVCLLAIGVHKVHIIPLVKPQNRTSLGLGNTQGSYGIMTLTSLYVSESDDRLELTFRMPLHKPKVLYLATNAAADIALRLRHIEERLRPEWESRPYTYLVPDEVKSDILRNSSPHVVDVDSLDRTLIGYCAAYEVNPENIIYQISYHSEDSPRFELLPRRPDYTLHELLAVMRALRYNESFGGISFASVNLDALNGLHDRYGSEHVCWKTKRGTPVQISIEELRRSSVLVQEIRALAISNKKLRRLDFDSCISRKQLDTDDSQEPKDIGCGIVEALFPLCRYQTTNVDWISLNHIQLSETDLDYLVAAAVEKACHFRGFGFRACGLTDRSLSLILESLRQQENTLDTLDISANSFRLAPSLFDSQIGAFAFIRSLDLSHTARNSGPEPLLSAETLQIWRLQELTLSGTSLNIASVEAICAYLLNFKQSKGLRELRLDHTYLTGSEIALIMHSISDERAEARDLHLDVSQNSIESGIIDLTSAISRGCSPKALSMKLIEFSNEVCFRKLINSFASNESIHWLDLSRASLPSDATEETSKALERLFSENSTLEYLDISGEESRLETSKFGVGINKALVGLETNKCLAVLRVQYQKLGLQGACTLADVLKVNQVLREVHCEYNNIPLSGFTDMVNSLHRNTTILYLPSMAESRQMALKNTEDQVKQMRDDNPPQITSKTGTIRSKLGSKVGNKPVKERVGPIPLSDQDIKAALNLVDESWSRQVYRLQLYLERNNNIANGVDAPLDIDEEEFERPSTGLSLGGVLEKVKLESTPTIEKQIELGGDSFVDKRSEATESLAIPQHTPNPSSLSTTEKFYLSSTSLKSKGFDL